MSRRALEYMLQMSAIQLKVLLNTACKVVDNARIFLLGDRCLQYSNGVRVVLVDVVLEEPSEEALPSVCCLNNLGRLSFVICLHPDLKLYYSQHDFTIFGWIYLNVNYFPAIMWKKKENKVNRGDFRAAV